MSTWSRTYSVRIPLLLLALLEFVSAFASVFLAAILLHGNLDTSRDVVGPLSLSAAVVATVILISLTAMGLYDFHQRLYFRDILARVVVGLTIGSVGLAALYYILPFVALPRFLITVAVVILFLLILLIHGIFFRRVDTNIFRRRTLIYGAGKRAAGIARLRRRADRRGFKLVGFIPAEGDDQVSNELDILKTDSSLLDLSKELSVDEIVIAMDERRGNLPIRDLLACKLAGINVIDLLEFLERESEKVRVDLVNPGWLIFSQGFRASKFRVVSKRVFDIAISVVGLLMVWPLMLLAALAIKIEDGRAAPVLYRQVRVGQFGENFGILKFRSMRENAESETGAVWAEQNDPRVTKVGHFLRKTRLDELPQLFNVARGQMSIVGPRPERPEFVADLAMSIPFYLKRHTVKPGITGWAQLRYPYGSSQEDAAEKLQYDLYYVKNHSILLDLLIILQTVEVIFWGKGAR